MSDGQASSADPTAAAAGMGSFTISPSTPASIMAAACVCFVCTTLATMIRICSRLLIFKAVKTQDVFGVLSFICQTALFAYAVYFAQIMWKLVDPQDGFDLSVIMEIPRIIPILTTCYCLALMFGKTAILLDWVDLFVPYPTRPAFFWVCCAIIFANVGLEVSAIVGINISFQQRSSSLSNFQDNSSNDCEGGCFDAKALDICVGALNLAIDVAILVLPHGVIWQLQMKRGRKLGLSALFSVGLLGCVCASLRLRSTVETDYTGEPGGTTIWLMCECACVLLVFCGPAAPGVFVRLANGIVGLTYLKRSRATSRTVYEQMDEEEASNGMALPTLANRFEPPDQKQKMDSPISSTTRMARRDMGC